MSRLPPGKKLFDSAQTEKNFFPFCAIFLAGCKSPDVEPGGRGRVAPCTPNPRDLPANRWTVSHPPLVCIGMVLNGMGLEGPESSNAPEHLDPAPPQTTATLKEPTMNLLQRLIKDESGATAIEYGLIAGLVAVAIIAALGTLGDSLNTLFSGVASTVSTAAS